jgi:hypothetical protein
MELWLMLFVGGFVLFLIIAGAVKMAVREALHEFKEEIVKEFNLKKTDVVENRNEN